MGMIITTKVIKNFSYKLHLLLLMKPVIQSHLGQAKPDSSCHSLHWKKRNRCRDVNTRHNLYCLHLYLMTNNMKTALFQMASPLTIYRNHLYRAVPVKNNLYPVNFPAQVCSADASHLLWSRLTARNHPILK